MSLEEIKRQIEQLRRELHDERVRRDEWEKMYNQAIADTEVRQLRAELMKAEVLAVLVTPRLAEVLERAAWIATVGRYPAAARHARELALHIRESLEQ